MAEKTENKYENAKRKVEEKNLDMIVLNDITNKDAGFKKDTNVITIINRKNEIYEYKMMTKFDVANTILDVIMKMSVS